MKRPNWLEKKRPTSMYRLAEVLASKHGIRTQPRLFFSKGIWGETGLFTDRLGLRVYPPYNADYPDVEMSVVLGRNRLDEVSVSAHSLTRFDLMLDAIRSGNSVDDEKHRLADVVDPVLRFGSIEELSDMVVDRLHRAAFDSHGKETH